MAGLIGSKSSATMIVMLTVAFCLVGGATAQADITDGLIALWTLDDGSGLVAEESINGNDGILQSGDAQATWLDDSEGKLGGAIRLDGDDYVALPSDGSLDINSNAMTLSLWVTLRVLPSDMPYSSKYGAIYDSNEDAYALYVQNGSRSDVADKELRFKVADYDNTAERPGIPEEDLVLNEWMHIVGVYDGDEGKAMIFLNGELKDVHMNSSLNGIVKTGQAAALGRDGVDREHYLDCDIDDIGIWDRALDPDEIAWLYNDGAGNSALTPTLLEVLLGIRPGSESSPINLKSKGALPVTIFGSEDVDVSQIDLSSLLLQGASPQERGKSGNVASIVDQNGDSIPDLNLKFDLEEMDIAPDALELILTGMLLDGTALGGSDAIRVVPSSDGNGLSFVFGDDLVVPAIQSQVLPEPATLSLLVLGGLAMLRRRSAK